MAKFFFKKDRRTKGPLRSQVVGIAWITAILIALLGYYFFSARKVASAPAPANQEEPETEKLAKKEDSVYRERRKAPKRIENKEYAAPSTAWYTHEAPPARKQALKVELNSADTTTLQLLHGIGPAFARRIVRYRERLGGFVADSQLLEVYGFTPELLDHIRPHLQLDTAIRRQININSVSLKALSRHPYIEYFQARDIVNLRSKGLTFCSEEDLRAVPSMADSTLRRLMPYMDFSLPSTEHFLPAENNNSAL